MANIADIPQINSLFNERQSLTQALAVQDPRINAMDWSGVILRTEYMEAPPQMYEGIRALMRDRIDDIDDELRRMGITNYERGESGRR